MLPQGGCGSSQSTSREKKHLHLQKGTHAIAPKIGGGGAIAPIALPPGCHCTYYTPPPPNGDVIGPIA